MKSKDTTVHSSGRAPVALSQPGLENLGPREWDRHAPLAHLFARHARHDLGNVRCALEMIAMVQRVGGASEDPPDLPPDLQPRNIQAKFHFEVNKLVSISSDLALLSQTVNPAAYQPARTVSVRTLVEDSILSRLGEGQSVPPALKPDRVAAGSVSMLGDQLIAALTAFYFQWTPGLHPHDQAAQVKLEVATDRLILSFPADNRTSAASFAKHLAGAGPSHPDFSTEKALSLTTTELALWLARFTVLIHGGLVEIDPADPAMSVRVTLPLAR